jgi:tocopherol O-methyltransferase
VVAIESTEHMSDKPRCFTEALRVLRPGGRLVVCAWLAGEHPRRWEVRHLLEPICTEGRLPGMGTAEEYRRMIEDAGFVVESFEDLTRQVKRTWPIGIARTLGLLRRDRELRRYLLSARSRNREFAMSPLRIWLAYRTGAMRYGLFVATRPRRSGVEEDAQHRPCGEEAGQPVAIKHG